MDKKINIAIDGPSGAGKSSIAQTIAKKYNYLFVNTGSLYRAIAYFCYKNEVKIDNEKSILKHWNNSLLQLLEDGSILLEKQKVDDELRLDIISKNASLIAKFPKIRELIVDILKDFQQNHKGIIMEGRDTTFVVMPQAELKIFLWADSNVRAKRRVEQNKELNLETNFQSILEEIEKRDQDDMNRKVNPLHKTEDSIFIDSTNLTFDQVVSQICKLVEQKLL
ncbi:(d)CMP kinase [Mesomycoplasma hyorhinis]|uniref:Cytidylate kinase n=1 Tax=Mesomycoplasma hyorhinis TaxID=2100 RepID=A0ABD6IDL1_MESHY|nr:(d)CMP kinase [Mesomycoplasma hyorhinis]MXR43624.1 (d)CMP kinase [Mesomycoplasma hyorhinis]